MSRKRKFVHEVAVETVSGIIATSIVAVMALLAADNFYSNPSLDGFWQFETTIEDTSYSAYKGMKVAYQVVLIQKDLELSGGGDKYSEQTATMLERSYPSGKARTPIEISGYIEKRLFSANIIHLNIHEFGSKRESTTFHKLTVDDKGELAGTFFSTIANSKGKVIWTRGYAE